MKQYTDKDQTAKLMELGFPRPQYALPIRQEGQALIHALRYSIGELIEFLPESFSKGDKYFHLDIFPARSGWFILYATYNKEEYHRNFKRELIDSLFDACITLKEEGVI